MRRMNTHKMSQKYIFILFLIHIQKFYISVYFFLQKSSNVRRTIKINFL